jgi:hypothetical protein
VEAFLQGQRHHAQDPASHATQNHQEEIPIVLVSEENRPDADVQLTRPTPTQPIQTVGSPSSAPVHHSGIELDLRSPAYMTYSAPKVSFFDTETISIPDELGLIRLCDFGNGVDRVILFAVT